MTRKKENSELIKAVVSTYDPLTYPIGEHEKELIIVLNNMLSFLQDISKSLAVIADSIGEEEDEVDTSN